MSALPSASPDPSETCCRLVQLLKEQLRSLQAQLNATFADNLTYEVRLATLSREFNVPEPALVLALRPVPLLRALLGHARVRSLKVTSDRRLQIVLSPGTVDPQ